MADAWKQETEDDRVRAWDEAHVANVQATLDMRLGPEYLSQRPGPGGGRKLTYIEGWRVVDLANEVFGFNGWSTSVKSLEVDYLDVEPETGRCQCGVSAIVRITLRDGAYHEDVGYGHAEGVRGKHAALEKCKKEAITDSVKRGLKTFGRLLGNCLYDRQYAHDVLHMHTPARPPLHPSELYRDRGLKRAAPEGAGRPATKAAAHAPKPVPGRAAQPTHTHAPRAGAAHTSSNASHYRALTKPEPRSLPSPSPSPSPPLDSEAATMALELELEDDMVLRQSQLAQELEDDV